MRFILFRSVLFAIATLSFVAFHGSGRQLDAEENLESVNSGDVAIFSAVEYSTDATPSRMLWNSEDLTPDALFMPDVKVEGNHHTYFIDSLSRLQLLSGIQHGDRPVRGLAIDGGLVIPDSNPAVVRWITDEMFELTATIEKFTPVFPDDIAGLLLYSDDANSIMIGKSIDYSGHDCIKIIAIREGILTHTATMLLSDAFVPVNLKIISNGRGKYVFMAAENNDILRYVGIPIPKFDSSPEGVMAGIYARKKRM